MGYAKRTLGDKMKKWDGARRASDPPPAPRDCPADRRERRAVRFFVLTFDAVYYFKFEEDFLAGRPAKGRIQLDKSIFFCEHDPASGDHLLQFRSLARVSEPLPATDARPGTLWADRRALGWAAGLQGPVRGADAVRVVGRRDEGGLPDPDADLVTGRGRPVGAAGRV